LWLCGPHLAILHPTLTFLSPLSKTFFTFDGIPFGKLIFFLLTKVMQVGDDEKSHNLSHLLAKKEPRKV
jgi:hypothetical protein